MIPAASASYDALPYNAKPIPQAHPDRMATVARLHGLRPAPIERCRVLDVGCADGAHIIPVAISHPGSHVVGFDFSAHHIALAKRTVADLALHNVSLLVSDIAEVDLEPESFDYVVAHGIYSWVSMPLRNALLALIRRVLKPNGIAFVSYNVRPGCHARHEARDTIRQYLRPNDDATRTASRIRALLRAFSGAMSANTPEAIGLKSAFAELARKSDSLLLYDSFYEISEPVFFQDFTRHASTHELAYLADASVALAHLARLSPEARAVLAEMGDDPIRREACIDVLTNVMFRQSLIVRSEAPVLRPLQADAIAELSSGCDAVAEGDVPLQSGLVAKFKKPNGIRVQIADPIAKAALLALLRAWPQYKTFPEVSASVSKLLDSSGVSQPQEPIDDTLQQILFELYTSGFIDLRTRAPACVRVVSEHPTASSLARWQAANGRALTNQHHQPVEISDKRALSLLALLDGTRSKGVLGRQTTADLDAYLGQFAKLALLIA